MRAVFGLVLVAACTPDIVSGSYLCGPDSACPEGQACNGPDNHCVLASTAEPFDCMPERPTEPDDTAGTAYELMGLMCPGVPVPLDNCMMQGDSEDWIKVKVPTECANAALTSRVSFPIAFERLSLEIWNIDTNTKLGDDTTCANTGEVGEEQRCVQANVTPGGTFGVKVRPAGDGNCAGNCSYNRYTLRVQLATSG